MGNYLVGASLTFIISSFFVWLFRTAISKSLQKSLLKDVELYKHELDAIKERMKFEIQKETFKAQIYSSRIHVVYPELFKALRVAEGGVAHLLGLRFAYKWEDCSEKDIRQMLSEKNAPGKRAEDVISEMKSNPEVGKRSLEELLNDIDVDKSKRYHHEAKNYLIDNSLYFSTTVISMSNEVLDLLWSAWVSATVSKQLKGSSEKYHQSLKDVAEKMKKLEVTMREEITPK